MGDVIGKDAVAQKRWHRLLARLADTVDRIRTACNTNLAAYLILAGPIGYRSDYPETASAIAGTLGYVHGRMRRLAAGDPSDEAVAEANRLLADLLANESRWSTLFQEERDRIDALRATPPRGFGGRPH